MGIFPPDRKCLVDLEILTRFHATPAKDALVRIVAIKGICLVDHVWLGPIRDTLVFNLQQGSRVVNWAIGRVCYRRPYNTEDGSLRSGQTPLAAQRLLWGRR